MGFVGKNAMLISRRHGNWLLLAALLTRVELAPDAPVRRRLGGSPPAVPTAVIVGSTAPDAPLAQAWHAAESAVAARAKLGWVLDAPGATHTSPLVRDRAYVVAAVDWLRSLPQPPVQTASVTAAGR